MRIRSISAKNFRALSSVELLSAADVNVVVGPNAVGKSTLLEVIRLTKIILAPRIQNEAQHALVTMGVLSPHNIAIGSPGIDFAALANDPTQPISLEVKFELNEREISVLNNSHGSLAMMLLQAEKASADQSGALGFTQYLSTPDGQRRMMQLMADVMKKLSPFHKQASINLALTLDPSQKVIRGGDQFEQAVISILDRLQPNHLTLISAFPADRSFPQGEQQIQLGSGDAQQQLFSHLAAPATKYSRLKQTIIQNVLLGRDGHGRLENEFNLIFDNLLPGKKFAGVSFNEIGLFKILVKDEQTGKTFDIDHMSSGEKGLVLTFLFIRLSVQYGGIVLLDEPELHLNSAVQSKIMTFLVEHCIQAKSLQAFVCTHSPEIVKDAYDRDDCSLFHLRSGNDLTPVHQQDHQEIFEIFGRLGSSAADVLFSRGAIYVEGPHDALILQTGYPTLVNGYKINALGGRGEIEREVPALQGQEKVGRLNKVQLFLMDNDRRPTKLRSSKLVHVQQLERYCIENYLIEDDLLFDLVSAHAKNRVCSRGAFPSELKLLALTQTRELAIWETYREQNLQPSGLKRDEFRNKNAEEVARLLAEKLSATKSSLADYEPERWMATFADQSQAREAVLKADWEDRWRDLCDGKALIDALYVKYEISMKKVEFKKDVIRRMAAKKTDGWRVLDQMLSQGLQLPAESED